MTDRSSSGDPGVAAPPVGDVTFLFTDIEGSTRQWEDHPTAMDAALAVHDEQLRAAVERHGGFVFTTAGDSFAVAFASAHSALQAAIDIQIALLEPCGPLKLSIRMGLHTGVASLRDRDYFGTTVNRCARLMSAGHGGQVLISGATRDALDEKLPPDVSFADLGEHRLKDLREPEHVFEANHPALRSDFPPIRSLDAASNNLPAQLTDFVGRSAELAEVRELLREKRLVTLLGSGGSGKTRLALQVAAESLEDHPGGTQLVELGPIVDGDLIAEEVAELVEASSGPDQPLVETIAARIGDRRMLLVLDNCEHLVDAAAALASELLTSCRELRVLATSQRPLDVPGEVHYRIPSLELPNRSDLAGAAASEAVQLFTERAATVRPGFALDEGNLESVTSICRRLDGIPLALELAAARVRVLSPAEIADRLDQRFRLLGGANRASTARHQTLRAAMDWSYEMLTDDERTVFRRLSVFLDDFTIEAAEAVCAGADVDAFAVIDHLTSLADKSLVVSEHDAAVTRYRLLESIRAYGAERLDDAAETGDVRARYTAHYRGVAESLYALRHSGEVRAALVAFDREEGNIRASLQYAFDNGDLTSVARMIRGIGHLWYLEGRFREGIEWCRRLVDSDPHLDDDLLAGTLHVHGTLLGSWREPLAGSAMLRREVDLLRTLDEPARLAAALNNLANLQLDLGLRHEARATLEEAISVYSHTDQSPSLALITLGSGYLDEGRYEDARAQFTTALAESTRAGDEYAMALSRLDLAHCSFLAGGDPRAARSEIRASQQVFRDLGVQPGVAQCDLILGHLERDGGRHDIAAAHLLAGLDDPDGHWYWATKLWILQLSASIVESPRLARELVTVAHDYYDSVDVSQPEWVLRDLAAARKLLGQDDGSGETATRPIDLDTAVERARAELRRVAEAGRP